MATTGNLDQLSQMSATSKGYASIGRMPATPDHAIDQPAIHRLLPD